MPKGELPGGKAKEKDGGKAVMYFSKKVGGKKCAPETFRIEIVTLCDKSALVN